MSLTQQAASYIDPSSSATLAGSRPRHAAGPRSFGIIAHAGNGATFVASLVAEARPPILGIFAVRIVVASRLLDDPGPSRIALTGAWVMITMAVYVFNGTSDIAGDRLNGSRRPLATGKLSIRAARIACSVLAACALAAAWWCGDGPGVCAAASLGLGWCYSAGPTLKRSSVGFSATIFGGAALSYVAGSDEARTSWGTWAALVTFAVWIGLCSGAKDLSDISGDRAEGRHTWPVLLGTSRTVRLLIVFASGATAIMGVVVAMYAPRLLPAYSPWEPGAMSGGSLESLRLRAVIICAGLTARS